VSLVVEGKDGKKETLSIKAPVRPLAGAAAGGHGMHKHSAAGAAVPWPPWVRPGFGPGSARAGTRLSLSRAAQSTPPRAP